MNQTQTRKTATAAATAPKEVVTGELLPADQAPAVTRAPAAAPAAAPASATPPATKPLTAAQAQAKKAKDLSAYLEKCRGAMAKLLPKTMTPDRLIKLAITAYNTNPMLAQCDFASIALSLMHAAELGLEPNTALGHCYLIPRKNGKTGKMLCTFLVGYRGMIELSRRSGEVETIEAQVVREGDEFEVEYGCNKHLKHLPSYTGAPGNMVAVYAIAKMKDGGYQFEVMTNAEINAIMQRANGQTNRRTSPWDTDYLEMARKTVVRRLFKYLPVSTESQRGIAAALSVEDGDAGDEAFVAGLTAAAIEGAAAGQEPAALPPAEAEQGIMPEQRRDALEEALG